MLKKKELKSFQAVVLILFPFPLHSTTLTRRNSTARWVQLNFERSGKQYDPTSTTITLISEIDDRKGFVFVRYLMLNGIRYQAKCRPSLKLKNA